MVHTRINRKLVAKGFTFWGQWTTAMSVVIALLFILAYYQTGAVNSQYRVLAALTLLGSVPCYSLLHVYHKKHHHLNGLCRLSLGWLVTLLGLASIGLLSNTSDLFSLEIIIVWSLLGLCVQILLYVPIHYLSGYYHRQLNRQHKTLIIGNNALALKLAGTLSKHEHLTLVGLVSLVPTELSGSIPTFVVSQLDELRALINSHGVRCLYIALSLSEVQRIEALYIDLLDLNVDVVWVPDLNSMTLLNHSVSELDGLPAIHLNESPLTSYPTAALSKALLDHGLALAALIVLSPLLLLIAIAVKLSSEGPVIFKQERHGWNGKIINVWKFRSMRLHDDQHVRQASRNDSRITAVGQFIRRTSLDELPQFFNVLQGHMALVGPRPHAIAHNDYYTGKIRAYMTRHRIKPGITGLAQISGCRGETETIDKMQKRVEIDLYYINNWSLWLDIKILMKTPLTLLSKNIY
ncbi:undecaprenyl-phosphate glucose phosphotransferase [Pseudomonas sp. MH9.2]|uniref:undecaprenyl-phosphate glucose phosphotransferase n=1 Tax=unclassified Pseudomonas TaxID=196821 RepID=UPI002AC9B2A4|nr:MULTISPECIES: undecaprenyl-phosphate glucose phosphotransferase [unclassified Pseudomonas]MEB0028804.1 undecaprenyl-phosphate glucose phosphotransferase [Pseudomonas sp. MH9.2]MEB0150084.1 undecaprenyl-phosphate glucose phosphotransferase [Pseudomonas sp. CCC2.2]WPX68857.1 undecaprenyl-phosphate glucose phosphotransferase [Pseudomonas sp. MH9.2]